MSGPSVMVLAVSSAQDRAGTTRCADASLRIRRGCCRRPTVVQGRRMAVDDISILVMAGSSLLWRSSQLRSLNRRLGMLRRTFLAWSRWACSCQVRASVGEARSSGEDPGCCISRESAETFVETLDVGVCEQRRPLSVSAGPEEGVRVAPQRDMRVGAVSAVRSLIESSVAPSTNSGQRTSSTVMSSALATSRISPARFSHRSV